VLAFQLIKRLIKKLADDAGVKSINAPGSLFGRRRAVLIDRVGTCRHAPPEKGAGSVDGLYPGIIRELFDEAFDELKGKHPDFGELKPETVRAAYFAQKNRRGALSKPSIRPPGKARRTAPRTTLS